MKSIFSDFVGILYPNVCLICGDTLVGDESQICIKCLHNIPRTNYHLQTSNPVEKRFWGKVNIQGASSFFFFVKGSPFQRLLHELKYKNNKEVGVVMGKFAAVDLLQNNEICSVDYIIPLPLHPKKFKKRGYNQSEMICNGLSEILDKPVNTTALIRVKERSSQTRKSVFERYENTLGVFELADSALIQNKKVLIVDDVLTTGSTLEAAIRTLQTCEGIKVYVFTLAVA